MDAIVGSVLYPPSSTKMILQYDARRNCFWMAVTVTGGYAFVKVPHAAGNPDQVYSISFTSAQIPDTTGLNFYVGRYTGNLYASDNGTSDSDTFVYDLDTGALLASDSRTGGALPSHRDYPPVESKTADGRIFLCTSPNYPDNTEIFEITGGLYTLVHTQTSVSGGFVRYTAPVHLPAIGNICRWLVGSNTTLNLITYNADLDTGSATTIVSTTNANLEALFQVVDLESTDGVGFLAAHYHQGTNALILIAQDGVTTNLRHFVCLDGDDLTTVRWRASHDIGSHSGGASDLNVSVIEAIGIPTKGFYLHGTTSTNIFTLTQINAETGALVNQLSIDPPDPALTYIGLSTYAAGYFSKGLNEFYFIFATSGGESGRVAKYINLPVPLEFFNDPVYDPTGLLADPRYNERLRSGPTSRVLNQHFSRIKSVLSTLADNGGLEYIDHITLDINGKALLNMSAADDPNSLHRMP